MLIFCHVMLRAVIATLVEGKHIFRSAARAVMSFICCGSTQKGFSARGGMFMLTRTFRLSYFLTVCL